MRWHSDKQFLFDRSLVKELADLQEQADKLEKAALLTKVRQLDVASHINDWLASPGLRPPT
jgi:hypothetical protein